jgi:RimJ/RimL family protein N-acetyltransferase
MKCDDYLKTGKTIKTINAKNHRKIVLRTPRIEDLDDLLSLINSLVEEKAEILGTKKFTRQQETEWLFKVLSQLEKDEIFFLVAETDSKVVASSDIQILSEDENQIGLIGIAVSNGFRNLGIGTEIMKTMAEQASLFGLKILKVSVFGTNNKAIHLYEKLGFVPVHRILKKHYRNGRFIDEIIMTKTID